MNRKILRLAIPNIISNITIPLLGIVDIAMMGHLEDEAYIGAIALGGTIFNFIYWGFGFLRMSTTGFTAQALGQRNFNDIAHYLFRGLLVAIAGGILLLFLQIPINRLSFLIIDGSIQVENLASEYFYIRIWAAPATISLYVLNGWFIGMQNTRFTMITVLTVNILNVVLNIFFVLGLGMKSNGVAWGTVFAQYAGLLVALALFLRYYKRFIPYYNIKEVLNQAKLKQFAHVNTDIIIRTLCLIFTFTFFTFKSAGMNDTLLAVNTLLLQFLMFFSYFIDGFAYSAEALVGKAFGNKNHALLRKTVSKLFQWGLGLAVVYTLIYISFGKGIVGLLTSNENVRIATKPYLFWIWLTPLSSFAAFIWDGIYIGAIATKAIRNTMFIASFVLFLPAYLLLSPYYQNHALWLAMTIFMLSRGLMLSITARKSVFKTNYSS